MLADPLVGPVEQAGYMLVVPLNAASPAVGLAVPSKATATDCRGVARDGAPDSGAYELWP
jgi:hypothetical protein